VGKKSAKIEPLIGHLRGRDLDARYLGYFECFNRGLFYEAHDVLEDLWLEERKGPDGPFYKGLIQLAGAFVHLQKGRLRPAAALFDLARANLEGYPTLHHQLMRDTVLGEINFWRQLLAAGGFERNPLTEHRAPQLAWLERG
jgi:hypothetical protein